MCTGLHHPDCCFLTNGSGDNNKGNIEAEFFIDSERRQPIESGHLIIWDDSIPRTLLKRQAHIRWCFYTLKINIESFPGKRAHNEEGVIFGVFDNQKAERNLCRAHFRYSNQALHSKPTNISQAAGWLLRTGWNQPASGYSCWHPSDSSRPNRALLWRRLISQPDRGLYAHHCGSVWEHPTHQF